MQTADTLSWILRLDGLCLTILLFSLCFLSTSVLRCSFSPIAIAIYFYCESNTQDISYLLTHSSNTISVLFTVKFIYLQCNLCLQYSCFILLHLYIKRLLFMGDIYFFVWNTVVEVISVYLTINSAFPPFSTKELAPSPLFLLEFNLSLKLQFSVFHFNCYSQVTL